jgi:hypothetical protein
MYMSLRKKTHARLKRNSIEENNNKKCTKGNITPKNNKEHFDNLQE